MKLAQIGFGYWGPNIARTLNSMEGVSLEVVYDANEARQQEAWKQYPYLKKVNSLENIFQSDVDGILIATPPETHFGLAKAALEAGKHIYVEKPLTTSLKDAEALVALAKQKKKIIFVDHVFVHSEPVKFLKNYIDSGELGDIFYVNARRINLGLFQYMVDVIWDLAIHDISIIDHLIGFDIDRFAVFKRKFQDFPRDAIANINADLKNNTSVNINVSWLSPVKVREIIFGGSKRTVVYNELSEHKIQIYDHGVMLQENLDTGALHSHLVAYKIGDVSFPKISGKQSLTNSLEHFVECLRKNQEPLTGSDSALRIIRLLEKFSGA